MSDAAEPYGVIARFGSAEKLVAAAQAARCAGYTRLEAISPISLPALSRALGHRGRRVFAIALGCGLAGAAAAYLLQHVASWDYPFVVGGKPIAAWVPFMIVTFAIGVLAAVIAAVLAMLLLNGYPRPYHPLFNAPAIERQSSDGFFLCIETNDPLYALDSAREFMARHEALDIAQVPR
jgi:hypothetical protein